MESVIEDGESLPEPSSIAKHQAEPEFAKWVWAVVEVDTSKLSGKTKRVNITLPERILVTSIRLRTAWETLVPACWRKRP
jgi:hypothetical protein